MKEILSSGSEPTAEAAALPASLVGLRAAADELLAVDPHALTDGELQDDVVGLVREIDRLAVALAARVAVWDAKMVWLLDGSASARMRLSRDTRTYKARAGRILREAHLLEQMPSVNAAILDGRLSLDHLAVFARACSPQRAELFARDEAVLVEQCAALRFDQAERAVDYWIIRADDELDQRRRSSTPTPASDQPSAAASGTGGNSDADHGADGDEEPDGGGGAQGDLFDPAGGGRDGGGFDTSRDKLHASRTSGGLCLDGWLTDHVDIEIVLGQLDAIEREMYLADQREGRSRLRSQRMVAALVEMARRSASAPPDAKPAKPLFVLCVGDGRAADLCQLASGHVVRVDQVAPYIDTAVIERFIFDGHTIIGGSARRSFTGLLRQAILARDLYGCTHRAGCDRHGTDLDVDHITPRIPGRPDGSVQRARHVPAAEPPRAVPAQRARRATTTPPRHHLRRPRPRPTALAPPTRPARCSPRRFRRRR